MEEKNNKNTLLKVIKELVPYVIILIVVVLIRTYLFTPIMVSGQSMKPTLDGGEIMILNKTSKINRFDIVVVDIKTEDIIKRVIALPGETISCENGVIYVNGKRQDESYSIGITGNIEKITLADDEYFVLGDNREDSLDSEELGPMKETQIKGVTSLVLFPFTKIGNVE
ncbi:MAG: signal peptidase I [Candidatus Coprovivens sp.]